MNKRHIIITIVIVLVLCVGSMLGTVSFASADSIGIDDYAIILQSIETFNVLRTPISVSSELGAPVVNNVIMSNNNLDWEEIGVEGINFYAEDSTLYYNSFQFDLDFQAHINYKTYVRLDFVSLDTDIDSAAWFVYLYDGDSWVMLHTGFNGGSALSIYIPLSPVTLDYLFNNSGTLRLRVETARGISTKHKGFVLSYSLHNDNLYSILNEYRTGYESAFERGYNQGYYEGGLGQSQGFAELVGAVIDVPINTISSLLDFNLMGTNLRALVITLFSLALVIAVVRLIL